MSLGKKSLQWKLTRKATVLADKFTRRFPRGANQRWGINNAGRKKLFLRITQSSIRDNEITSLFRSGAKSGVSHFITAKKIAKLCMGRYHGDGTLAISHLSKIKDFLIGQEIAAGKTVRSYSARKRGLSKGDRDFFSERLVHFIRDDYMLLRQTIAEAIKNIRAKSYLGELE